MYKPVLAAVCVVLAGCAGEGVRASDAAPAFAPDERPLAKTLVYDCGGYQVIARLGPGEMALWLPDRYLVLSQVRSGSGTRYQEGDVEFWSKGEEAMLTVGDQHYRSCQQVPGRVPWEDARRRGVEFRAVGNEPGWNLEIQQGETLLFVGDYGMLRVVMPDPGVQPEGRVRVYHAVNGANDLRVEILDEPCNDTMSGEPFPASVTVTLNGARFYGCGRTLDYPWM